MINESCSMVIFGGTGDLAHRKLAPALYNLHQSGQLSPEFSLIGIGRKDKTSKLYRAELAASVREKTADTWNDDLWFKLAGRIHYLRHDLQESENFSELLEAVEKLSAKHGAGDNYLYYLAVPPNLFAPIATNLGNRNLATGGTGWRRILIEKPFGWDLVSAAELNVVISSAFGEENIYRIDHYLGKEMLQNVMVIRFGNTIFEPLWNSRYIDNVQITVAENDGILDRGRYYDRTGALRDMVQSHLLQMLAATAMEPPEKIDAKTIRGERLKLLNAMSLWPEREAVQNVVFGQYQGYLQEKSVSLQSDTETYSAIKISVDNSRWRGVPFYLRTGKKLQGKLAKIVIQYKRPPALYSSGLLDQTSHDNSELSNLLTIKVQPDEGAVIRFNIRKPKVEGAMTSADMDFCRPCAFGINSPEAYERLLADAINGDQARFTGWNEVESSWRLTDHIYREQKRKGLRVISYEPGSRGPTEAVELLKRDGRHWWD